CAALHHVCGPDCRRAFQRARGCTAGDCVGGSEPSHYGRQHAYGTRRYDLMCRASSRLWSGLSPSLPACSRLSGRRLCRRIGTFPLRPPARLRNSSIRSDVPRFITFVVRTVAEPSSVLAAVRQAIVSEDRNLPITAASTLTELVDTI